MATEPDDRAVKAPEIDDKPFIAAGTENHHFGREIARWRLPAGP